MDGIFVKQKKTSVIFLVGGLGLIAIALAAGLAVSQGYSGTLFLLIWVGMMCIIAAIGFFNNHGAYFRLEENAIHAKFGWFGKLNCRVDEVAFVLPQYSILSILLKDGSRRIVSNLTNAGDLCCAIRRKNFSLEEESPDTLRRELKKQKSARIKWILGVVFGAVMMVANPFVTAMLTGNREMYEFTKVDWVLFAEMGVIELLTLVGMCYAAKQSVKRMLPIEHLKFRLRGAVIASQPLPAEPIRHIYTDESYAGRMIVCGQPNGEGVYYIVQRIVKETPGDFRLEGAYTSGVFGSEEDIAKENLVPLFDISYIAKKPAAQGS